MNMELHAARLSRIAYPVELLELHGIELMTLDEVRRRNRIRGMQSSWLKLKAAKATPAKSKPKKINRDRRRHLTEKVIEILRSGVPTVFAHEADCRNGLRVALCLDGWMWNDAEVAAEGILLTALRYIGAKRPTWIEGQPEHTQEGYAPVERTRCVRCGGNMSESSEMQNGWERTYCSDLCRNNSRLQFERDSGERRTKAQYWAAMAAYGEVKKLQRERPCKRCGRAFIPRSIVEDVEHCSKSCGSKSAQAKRKIIKPCNACGENYHASAPGAGKMYCSKACFDSINRLRPAPCEWCSSEFMPRSRRNRFCSTSCSAKWRCSTKTESAQSAFVCEATE